MSQEKILKFLAGSNNKWYSAKRISKKLDITHCTASRSVNKLVRQGRVIKAYFYDEKSKPVPAYIFNYKIKR